MLCLVTLTGRLCRPNTVLAAELPVLRCEAEPRNEEKGKAGIVLCIASPLPLFTKPGFGSLPEGCAGLV